MRLAAPAPRRFHALVNEHGWRIAAHCHFPEVAAALAAALAGRSGATAAGRQPTASRNRQPPPAAVQWRAAYKLLTLVPFTECHTRQRSMLAPWRRRESASMHAASLRLPD
jgi:hypothetical protein